MTWGDFVLWMLTAFAILGAIPILAVVALGLYEDYRHHREQRARKAQR